MKAIKTTTARINKSNVMKAAWEIIKKHEAVNFSDALRKAWKGYKLKAEMAVGVVKFTFMKLNGEIRNAVGTLSKNLYQYDYKGKGGARPASTICYFDVEKKAFRSFCVASLK